MIFTHTGKLGDFFLTLPIANWYYRTYGEKIHYVVSNNFNLFEIVLPGFHKYIPCVEKVSYVPHILENLACGGQPYKFNPEEHGISGQYLNLGFRHFPNKYATNFIAEEYDLGISYDELFTIKSGVVVNKDKVFTNEHNNVAPTLNLDEWEELLFENPLEDNVARMYQAKEIRCFMSGFSILCDLMKPTETRIYINKSVEGYGAVFYKHHNYYMQNNRYILI